MQKFDGKQESEFSNRMGISEIKTKNSNIIGIYWSGLNFMVFSLLQEPEFSNKISIKLLLLMAHHLDKNIDWHSQR